MALFQPGDSVTRDRTSPISLTSIKEAEIQKEQMLHKVPELLKTLKHLRGCIAEIETAQKSGSSETQTMLEPVLKDLQSILASMPDEAGLLRERADLDHQQIVKLQSQLQAMMDGDNESELLVYAGVSLVIVAVFYLLSHIMNQNKDTVLNKEDREKLDTLLQAIGVATKRDENGVNVPIAISEQDIHEALKDTFTNLLLELSDQIGRNQEIDEQKREQLILMIDTVIAALGRLNDQKPTTAS